MGNAPGAPRTKREENGDICTLGCRPDESRRVGRAELHRVGRWRFPVFELTQDGNVPASLGRSGWVKVPFGRGQRIVLADGNRWPIRK